MRDGQAGPGHPPCRGGGGGGEACLQAKVEGVHVMNARRRMPRRTVLTGSLINGLIIIPITHCGNSYCKGE